MKKTEWNEGLSLIDNDIVESFIEQKESLKRRKRKRNIFIRYGAIAACLALIIGVSLFIPIMSDSYSVANPQAPSKMPCFFGSEQSVGPTIEGDLDFTGISVTAELVEILPDTYIFFDEWHQMEFRLLRMKTVTLLKGEKMTKSFLYLIPTDYMTDFTKYSKFVILDMAQIGYDSFSVMYNVTDGKAEQLGPIFGYSSYYLMGESFIAYDADGNFDSRLWRSTKAWIDSTKYAQAPARVQDAEAKEISRRNPNGDDLSVKLLNDISLSSRKALGYIKSFDNGIFVPTFSSMRLYSDIKLDAVRYIEGFATNESVSIRRDSYAFSKARFTKEDLENLPNLSSAFASVSSDLEGGLIKPPHLKEVSNPLFDTTGAFGWYAKTENGVIGIIRVTWCFYSGLADVYYDDAYFVIEYGSDTCTQISRDVLVQRLGNYEKAFIFMGEYNENGKILPVMPIV